MLGIIVSKLDILNYVQTAKKIYTVEVATINRNDTSLAYAINKSTRHRPRIYKAKKKGAFCTNKIVVTQH
jgi:hypothetical protein